MTINFFSEDCQQSDITHNQFGLCDDEDGNVAYVDTANSEKWIATVDNAARTPITFSAIDNCIEIRKPNGDLESRCDAMLRYPDNIVFVELKNKISKGWIMDGLNQLETTLINFRQNHDLDAIRHKRAYLSNRRRRHFHVIEHELKRRFFDIYKVRINIEGKIPIK